MTDFCDYDDNDSETHVLHHLHRIETRLSELKELAMTESAAQTQENADVTALRTDFDAFKAKIAAEVQAVKDAQAAGQPVDLTNLDALVKDENAETAPPVPSPTPAPVAAPAPGEQPPVTPPAAAPASTPAVAASDPNTPAAAPTPPA